MKKNKKPKIYYCNTIYSCSCGKLLNYKSDINPLILQANPKSSFLVLCAREGQVKRISNMLSDSNFKIMHYGWWDSKKMGLIDINYNISHKELLLYDIVIILDKSRIDTRFLSLCNAIESFCNNNNTYIPPNNSDPSPLCA